VATAISMPRLGMTMEEGTVVSWPLPLGAPVSKGETLLIIESEKNEVEIEAPASGVLRHVYVEEGETVPCGSLLGAITETDDEAFDPEAFHAAEHRPEDGGGDALRVGASAARSASSGPVVSAGRSKPVAPAARAAARKLGIDPQTVPGTGPGGRVTKADVEQFAAAREALVPVADGVSLEVLVAGEGEPVVLLPGLGTDVSAFARQTPALVERFRVHAVNPRGVGLSDAPDAECYEVARTAEDAAAVFDGAAHVIGASLGAAAALELALSRPDRVRSLTLITPFVEATPRLRAVAEGWARTAAETTPETLAAALLPWFFSAGFLADDAARGRTLRGLAQTLSRVPAATIERASAGVAVWSGTRSRDLSTLDVPTLVVIAGEDLLTPGAEAIADAIPGAKRLVVAGAGHAVALEAPEVVNEAILAHIG
jgi:pyruvate dehydrogenase E2 component (dihydrolipoamide acetyltransferase)